MGDHGSAYPVGGQRRDIEGKSSVLVFETGLGPRSGKAVLEKAKEIAGRRDLLLTISHFHPEHGFGAQEFKGVAHIVYNELQRLDLLKKGQQYLTLFRDFGPNVADALAGPAGSTVTCMPSSVILPSRGFQARSG